VQLAGAADGDEPDYLPSPQWVFQDPSVDHRRLDTAIAPQGIDNTQAVIERHQLSKGGKISHD
jgi:hypothetical protein